jgi:hypothetical protein
MAGVRGLHGVGREEADCVGEVLLRCFDGADFGVDVVSPV